MNSTRYDYIGDATGFVFASIQTNEVLQWVSFAITMLATIISLAYSIYQWVKKAKSDNKITKEEIDDLANIIKSTKDKVDDLKGKGKGE